MAIRYKKRKITLQFDKENKVEKFVAANVLMGSISYAKLCDEVNQRTGIHRSLVDVALTGVLDTMTSFIEEGFSVRLGNFGSFRPSLQAACQDDAEDVNAGTIVRKKIVFTPGHSFKQMLGDANLEQIGDNMTNMTGNDSSSDPGSGQPDSGGGSTGGGTGETPDPAA